jgi:hypothetical protein
MIQVAGRAHLAKVMRRLKHLPEAVRVVRVKS